MEAEMCYDIFCLNTLNSMFLAEIKAIGQAKVLLKNVA